MPGDNLAAARSRSSAREPAASCRRSRSRSTSASRSPPGWGAGARTPPPRSGSPTSWPGRPLEQEELVRLAADLGSDVPSQLDPLHALVEGTGERIEPVSLPPFTAVLIPDEDGLSTAAVYAELDRLGGTRDQLDPEPLRRLATSPLAEVAGLAAQRPRSRRRCRSGPTCTSASTR